MRKRLRTIVSILCVAAMFTSCAKPQGEKPNPPKDEQSNEQAKENPKQGNLDVITPSAYSDVSGIQLEPGSYISIIGKNQGLPYWQEVKKGTEKAAEDLNRALGYKGEDKIRVNYSAPSKGEDVEEQINILDEELARNPVALGIAIIDSKACEVQFDLAAENNGIPIIAFDSGSDYKSIQAMCSANNREMGEIAAANLAAMLGEMGDVALIVHDSESTSGKIRENSFLETIKESYPNIHVPVVYHLDELEKMSETITAKRKEEATATEKEVEEEALTQTDVIRYLFEENPNLKGCFTTNAQTTSEVQKVLKEMGKTDMTLIAMDGGDEQIKALEEGSISGLIVQNPYGMGYAAVVAAARAALGMGNEAFVDTGYVWVTKDNMADPNIQKLLY